MYSNVQTPQGKLIITVNKAILSYDACTFGTMDPYFVAGLSTTKSYRSFVRKDEGKYPIWKETFELEYANEDKLSFDVYHDKEYIGGVEVPVKDVLNSGVVENVYYLS